jgi:PTS system mannose-specific IIA component
MIGFIIVTHGNLGKELIQTAELILNTTLNVSNICIPVQFDFDTIRKTVKDSIKSANKGSGVIVLTDLFGGTPSNICITLLDEMVLEIISGVNLPMVLKTASIKETKDIKAAVEILKKYGQMNISSAREFLKKE